MPASKRKPARRPVEQGELISLRLPASLRQEIAEDVKRLQTDASSWWRAAARAKLDSGLSDELRAIREVVALARARGVTMEALAEAARLESEP